MIRPLTCLCLLAACGSGLYLYAEKHRAEMLDRDIAHVMRATQAAHERTGVLRAEWALLNEPGRLQDLASRYLHLQPMSPAQFVRLADLGAHLPPPVAPPAQGATDEDDTATDGPATPADAAAPVASTTQAAPPPAPVQLADKPKPPHPARLASRDTAHAHHTALADATPLHATPLARGTPLALAAPQPVGAPVMSAIAHPLHNAPAPVIRAVPAYAGMAVRSAIGGTGTLPPPVPLSPGEQ